MATNRPGEQVLSEALRTIAAEAGVAVVDTARSDLWAPFQQQVASWLAREGGQAERSELARLAETAAALRTTGDAEARTVAAVWQDRFIALLERLAADERVPAADHLRRLVHDHSSGSTETAAAPGVIAGQNVRIQADHGALAAGVVNGDEVEADDRTAEAVGRRLGLPSSPATLIARVADGAPALLVVDQLDAASSYSGRIPDVFEAVDDMLEALTASPNIKVVLIARTVDVEKDPRLTSLAVQEGTVERFPLGLLDAEAVRTVLEAGGTSPQTLGRDTLDARSTCSSERSTRGAEARRCRDASGSWNVSSRALLRLGLGTRRRILSDRRSPRPPGST
ncbi:hypothetical protein ACFVTP_05575 [Streptomyces celluloflavus]|uniref:hypothetical protein n=1 Tax=Streptomyces celluloflavus TaxID=58344 RepID=UPI0036DD591B